MPPKRKRAAEVVANTEDTEAAPLPKKRTTTAKAPSTRSTRKAGGQEPSTSSAASIPSATKKKSATSTAVLPPPPRDLGVYSDQQHAETFALYADEDDPKVMSSDGVQRLFVDAGIELEGVVPFLLAWSMKARELGVISADEWKSLKELKIDRPSKLQVAMNDLAMLFYPNFSPAATAVTDSEPVMHASTSKSSTKGKKAVSAHVQPSMLANLNGSTKDVYDKLVYHHIAQDPKKSFKDFYTFCFGFMKNADARVMEMETAVATWEVVLQPKFPVIGRLIEFIRVHPSYKAVNKDLWTMTLEFCYAAEEKDLMEWNDDESWPSLLDEFVAWEKTRLGSSKGHADGDVVMAEG